MTLIPEIRFSFNNLWLLSVIYFIISSGFLLLFPKYNISKFVKTPRIKYITSANYFFYYGFLFFSIFIPMKFGTILFYLGLIIFVLGILIYSISMFYFAISEYDKPVTEKIYKISRHPVYLSFLLISIGISFVGESIIMIVIAILHFLTTIFIIKKEEIQCIEKYGEDYKKYMKKVRMIL